jgi:hypothetical protein
MSNPLRVLNFQLNQFFLVTTCNQSNPIASIFACHNMQSKKPNCINKFCLSQHAIKETQLYQFFLVTTCNQSNPICIPKDSEDPLLNLLGRITILKCFKKIRVSFVAISLSLSLSLSSVYVTSPSRNKTLWV